jgi:hypothetical protein
MPNSPDRRIVVEPDPEFVAELDAVREIAEEMRDAARELISLAGQLMNHANLQWARYSKQLVDSETEEAPPIRSRKVKVKRKS